MWISSGILFIFLNCGGNILSLELAPYSLPENLYPDKKAVTVSGAGFGGLIAQSLQIAQSYYIRGVAVYSSTFYRCGLSNGNKDDFNKQCTKNTTLTPDQQDKVTKAVSDIQSYETNRLIDPAKYLRYIKVYVFSGLQDATFTATQQLNVVALFEKYLESPYQIKTRVQDTAQVLRVIDASSYTSSNYHGTCGKAQQMDGTVEEDCAYLSAPAEALEFLTGGSYSKFVNPFYGRYYKELEPLRSFNQSEFTKDLTNPGLDDVGYLYVPKYCQHQISSYGRGYGKACALHIYFHDCSEGREFQGTTHVKYSNYLEIAEANNIIMLFPQALSSTNNPKGCWDYNGMTGMLYATKKGVQIMAVWKMIARILYIPVDVYSTRAKANDSGPKRQKQRQGPAMKQNVNYNDNYANDAKCSSPSCSSKTPPFY